MAETEDLDFSNFDGIDELDWSDVEDELKKNKEMVKEDAGGGNALMGGGDMMAGGETAKISHGGQLDINFLLDVPLKMTVEVGRSTKYIKDLLDIDVESILELEKKVGEPLDVLVNKKLVARGEIIVQNEKFGLKIIQVVSKEERLENIKGI